MIATRSFFNEQRTTNNEQFRTNNEQRTVRIRLVGLLVIDRFAVFGCIQGFDKHSFNHIFLRDEQIFLANNQLIQE